MRIHRVNWQLWTGFLLSVFAFMSYPTIFVEWPLTRDFPWVNILLFVVAAALLFLGLRRAFGPGRGLISRIGAIALATMSIAALAFFILVAFVASTWLPASSAAPRVGQKAPEFSLTESNGKVVSLTELRTAATGSLPTRGVLLIFYRGYW